MTVLARSRRVDDEDEDINDFDPAYFPRKVYKDGRGPRVRLMLTDAAPPSRRAPSSYDAAIISRVPPWSTPPIRTSGTPSAPTMTARSGFRTHGAAVGRMQPPANGMAMTTTMTMPICRRATGYIGEISRPRGGRSATP